MKILRLTRHEASQAQLAELRRIYGDDITVLNISETVPNSLRVRELVEEHGADVIEAVLPLPFLAEVLRDVRIPVIRAVMRRELKDGGEVEFHFDHYERVLKIEVVTERL